MFSHVFAVALRIVLMLGHPTPSNTFAEVMSYPPVNYHGQFIDYLNLIHNNHSMIFRINLCWFNRGYVAQDSIFCERSQSFVSEVKTCLSCPNYLVIQDVRGVNAAIDRSSMPAYFGWCTEPNRTHKCQRVALTSLAPSKLKRKNGVCVCGQKGWTIWIPLWKVHYLVSLWCLNVQPTAQQRWNLPKFRKNKIPSPRYWMPSGHPWVRNSNPYWR